MLHGFNLTKVDLYPPISDQVSQELTSPYTKSALLSIKTQLMLSKHLKRSLKILYMPTFLFTFYYHVINVHFDCASYFILENPHHHPLVHGPSIFQPNGHHSIMIIGIRGDECCLFSILGCQGNLMIPLKGIQEAHPQVSYIASTNWLIFGIGNRSFGHAQFKPVKSTQTLHLSLFFFTITVFASYSRKKISLIALASFSL